MSKVERDDKNKTSNMIKDIKILKIREGATQELERPDWDKRSRISDDSGEAPD